MKLFLQENQKIEEMVVDITYNKYNRHLHEIVQLIESNTIPLEGFYKNEKHLVKTKDIYYIESVDNLTFLYTESEVFENREKLYVLEKELKPSSFLRINKSTLLNMDYLKSVSPLPNYRLEATLLNSEKVVINRHYIKSVKQYLNI